MTKKRKFANIQLTKSVKKLHAWRKKEKRQFVSNSAVKMKSLSNKRSKKNLKLNTVWTLLKREKSICRKFAMLDLRKSCRDRIICTLSRKAKTLKLRCSKKKTWTSSNCCRNSLRFKLSKKKMPKYVQSVLTYSRSINTCKKSKYVAIKQIKLKKKGKKYWPCAWLAKKILILGRKIFKLTFRKWGKLVVAITNLKTLNGLVLVLQTTIKAALVQMTGLTFTARTIPLIRICLEIKFSAQTQASVLTYAKSQESVNKWLQSHLNPNLTSWGKQNKFTDLRQSLQNPRAACICLKNVKCILKANLDLQLHQVPPCNHPISTARSTSLKRVLLMFWKWVASAWWALIWLCIARGMCPYAPKLRLTKSGLTLRNVLKVLTKLTVEGRA